MFSSTAEYALRAVAYLALHTQGLSSSQVIARHTKVPHGYLSKILNALTEAGIVNSKRGPRGGFSLECTAESLSVLQVINAVDPIRRITRCPLNIPSHGVRLCKLHRRLDDAIAMVERALAESTLAEMIERQGLPRDCSFPLEAKPAVLPTVRGRPRRPRAS